MKMPKSKKVHQLIENSISYLNLILQFDGKNSFEFQKITFNLFGFHSWCICCGAAPPMAVAVLRDTYWPRCTRPRAQYEDVLRASGHALWQPPPK